MRGNIMTDKIVQEVQIVLAEGVQLPEYATSGSAGMDLRAFLPEQVTLYPYETKRIPTGLKVAMPENLCMAILPRSGHALRGMQVANAPGLIDSDYREDIGVLLYNSTENVIVINPNDRIAQLKFEQVTKPSLVTVGKLDTTERKGGFGSTGVE